MNLGSGQLALGLDIGQSATKLVVLRGTGQGVEVAHCAVTRNREEGIVDQEDLQEHLQGWLAQEGQGCREMILGLPQYLAIAQLTDFPESSPARLDDMVAYETQQLAGLSDESFLNGYHQFTPFAHHKNPVLIGVARESAVRERLALVEPIGPDVQDLVMDGQALAMAARYLCPEETANDELQMVLDIGAENTTVVLLQSGAVVYVGSVMYAGDNFTEAISRHLAIATEQAERAKRQGRVNPADQASPITDSAKTLAAEIEAGLENWRFQLNDEAEGRIHRVYLSGGGAQLEGLPEYLEVVYDCPVQRLAVPKAQGDDGEVCAVACGLALAAFPAVPGHLSVSLLPEDVRWLFLRRRRAPLLIGALAICLLLVVGYLALSYYSLQLESARLAAEKDKLDRCQGVIQDLECHRLTAVEYQEMLRPFVAVGNRNIRMAEAVEVLGRHQRPGDWLFLIADEDSYKGKPVPSFSTSSSSGSGGGLFNLKNENAPTRQLTSTREVKPWSLLYAAGFTPYRERNLLDEIQKTVSALNDAEDSIFERVDVMSETERSGVDRAIQAQWQKHFKLRLYAFALYLPLKDNEFGEAP